MSYPKPEFKNPFRHKLENSDGSILGIWSMLNSFNVTEGLAWAGFDWLCIDGEHAPVDIDDATASLRILDGTPTLPILRLAWNDRILIKRHLDAGAQTLMLPFVQTAEEAREAVSQMHYPPRGRRGVAGMHRASRFGAMPDYLHNASESLFLIVQIETLEAMESLDDILAVDGVDAVFFGPGDLSASMGLLGDAGAQAVSDLICSVLPKVKAAGKYAGTLAVTDAQSEGFIYAGFDFVSVANDCALLFGSARAKAKLMNDLPRPATQTRQTSKGVQLL
jgi:4-hydroxy-2-oxoheptanedioate aldolase